MANDVVNQLMRMKREAEQSAQEAAELKGRINQIEVTLKEEFDCDSIEEANTLLTQLKKQSGKLEQEITDGVKEIKQTYGF